MIWPFNQAKDPVESTSTDDLFDKLHAEQDVSNKLRADLKSKERELEISDNRANMLSGELRELRKRYDTLINKPVNLITGELE